MDVIYGIETFLNWVARYVQTSSFSGDRNIFTVIFILLSTSICEQDNSLRRSKIFHRGIKKRWDAFVLYMCIIHSKGKIWRAILLKHCTDKIFLYYIK